MMTGRGVIMFGLEHRFMNIAMDMLPLFGPFILFMLSVPPGPSGLALCFLCHL